MLRVSLSVVYNDVLALFFFFFQAEDGIRDHCVTGVQTCALPICVSIYFPGANKNAKSDAANSWSLRAARYSPPSSSFWRSEERRVGKECRSRWWPYD